MITANYVKGDFMLLCAQYVVPVTAEPIENGALLVQDGKIADLGPADTMCMRYPHEEVYDYGMAAITPGFIDLYSRGEDAVLRGLISDLPYIAWGKEIERLRSKIPTEDLFYSAYLGGLESISSGVTTVADITASGAGIAAAQKLGQRGVFYRETSAVDKRLVDYALKKTDADLEKWSQEIDSDRITLGIAAAPVFRCHPLIYTKVAEYATKQGNLPVALTIAGSREEHRFVKYGKAVSGGGAERFDIQGFVEVPPWLPTSVSPVNYVLNWKGFDANNVMAIHCVRVSDEDITKLKEYDVAVAICPSFTAQLGMGVAPLGEFLRAGLRVGLGTDAPSALDSVDIFTEMRVELLIQRALTSGYFLTSQTLLEMGTIRAAKVLGLDSKIGSLEVGKRADIVAVDLSGSHQATASNPISAMLSYASNSDVVMTMVDGKMLFERGQWHVEGEVAKNIAHVLEVRNKLRA